MEAARVRRPVRRAALGARPRRSHPGGLSHGVPHSLPRPDPARPRRGATRVGAVVAGGVGRAPQGGLAGAGRRIGVAPQRAARQHHLAGPASRRERAGGAAGDPGVERWSPQDSGTARSRPGWTAGAAAGGGHTCRPRHRGGRGRGPEPLVMMSNRMNGIRIAPSLLSADLTRLAEQVGQVLAAGADWLHVDVMDGRFVPNLTFGANMIEALRRLTDKPIDVHLMVLEPERYLEAFPAAGASVFTFHPEATLHVQRQLAAARSRGMLAGLALNPGSPLSLAEEVIADVDLLLVMTVNPGFGGQSYLASSDDKIRRARELLTARGSRAFLEVDGGVTAQTIATAHAAGADTFVVGNAIFASPDPAREVRDLKRRCLVTV